MSTYLNQLHFPVPSSPVRDTWAPTLVVGSGDLGLRIDRAGSSKKASMMEGIQLYTHTHTLEWVVLGALSHVQMS